MKHHNQRVNDLLRLELSEILRREVKDPRVALASVSAVEVTRDLAHAQVWISVLGDDDEQRADTIATLERARGFVRSVLARRVRLRTVPELVFKLDRGAEHSQRISELLESLHHDDASGP